MSNSFDINSKLESYTNPPDNYNYELGYTLFQSGKFKRSIPYLKDAFKESLNKKNHEQYLDCYNILLQIFIELDEAEELKTLQKEFKKDSVNLSIKENVRTLACNAYYYLSLNNSKITDIQIETNNQKAFEILTQALKLALDEHALYSHGQDRLKDIQAKMDVMHSLYMFCEYYCHNQQYEKCIKDLDNLNILLDYYFNLKEELQLDKSKTDNFAEQKNYHEILEVVKKNYQIMQRMRLGVQSLEFRIEFEYKKDAEKSDKILWKCYELANKTNNSQVIPYIFLYMAYSHQKLQDLEQATIFLNLAEKQADPDRKLFFHYLKKYKETTGLGKNGSSGNYDLIFNEDDHSIVEKQKGCVNFKNQFILLELLKLFITHQGDIYSKQSLVEQIWKQEYFPSTHDNKIYVTIKRLRELLEVDINNPKYICRNSRGYYLNNKIRILTK